MRQRGLRRFANGAGNTKGDEESDVDERTPDVNGAAAEVRCQDPREHDEEPLESGCNQTKSKGSVCRYAGLLEEVDSLVGDEVTSQVLRSVDTADDESAVEISATEQFKVVGVLDRLLEIDGTTHHGDGLAEVQAGAASETANCVFGFFEAALADEPPGRLWREVDENGERSGEHPLKRNWDPESLVGKVRIFGCAQVHTCMRSSPCGCCSGKLHR